jgi:hypothetical protein
VCRNVKHLAEHVAERSIGAIVRDSLFDYHMTVIPVRLVTDNGDLCPTLKERLD